MTGNAQIGQFAVRQSFKLIERAAIGAVLCKPLRNAGEETAEPELSAYERGLTALKAGQCDDARSAILEAIAEGSGDAALLMAENQDSVDFESCMTETPNDIRALGNYSAACKAGVDGAKEKLEALEAALTARSDGGDVVASEVLRVAFPKAKEACSE